MKSLLSIIFGLLMSTSALAGELTICSGKYALCAASTCKLTGKKITTNDGKTYPEVICKCPVIDGKSIADTSAGVMKGTCNVDDPSTQVWSLFAPKTHYPQQANNFVTTPKSATRARVQTCSGDVALGSANCWGMMCKYQKNPINGTVVANCSCPIAQIPRGTEFLTEAGQGDPLACNQHPVAAPDPFADAILNVNKK
jgi:hypothetical protein